VPVLGDRLTRLRDALRLDDPRVVFGALLLLLLAVTYLAPAALVDRSDEPGYLGYAERLTHGRYAVHDGSPFDFLWRGPGLPLLLAPFVWLDAPIELMRLTGPVLLLATAYLLYRMLIPRFGPGWALAGAAALGLYFPIWRLLPRIFSEPLALLLLVGSMTLFGIAVRERTGPGRVVLAGLLLGGTVLVRVEYGYVATGLLLVSLIWWAVRRASPVAGRSVLLSAVALVACVPWLVYTHHETGKAPYWSSSGGLSLYWMATGFSEDLGEPHVEKEVQDNPDLAKNRPFFATLPSDPVARDEALREEASDNIKDDPLRYARNLAANFSREWTHWPYSYGQATGKLMFYAIPGLALFVALVTSLVVVARRRWFYVEYVPFALFALGAMALHTLAAGYPRSIWPLLPVILVVLLTAVQAWHGKNGGAPSPNRVVRHEPAGEILD